MPPPPTLFVRSLPTSASNERLLEIFSEIGPIKQCFVVNEKGTDKCRGFGYVTYSMEEDAQRAIKEIKEYDGQRISLSVAKKKINDKKKPAPKDPAPAAPEGNERKAKGIRKNTLKSRLIIRNLSFKCSEEDLKQTFAKFGTVLEAKIPLKPDGKMRGFAFVLFKNVCEAGRALNAMNLKEIKGRQVAVDWAVPKDKFVATQPPSSTGPKKTEKATAGQSHTDSDSEEEEEEEEKEDGGQKKQAAPPTKKIGSKPAAQQMKKSQLEDEDDSEDDSEEEEDDVDDDEDEDDEDEVEESEDAESQEGEDHDESSLESDEDDDDEEDEDLEEELEGKKTQKKLLPSDVKEGRTVFIRNLSFDTEEEGLEEVLLQYGELNYIKIVLHPDTEHSKGCAFAQFKSKEAAEKCIAAAQDEAESGGIRVDGRKLLIVAAVSREDASKLKVKKVKVETGTRNLYLAREGLIRAGTKAAEGVPAADMAKRARFEEVKRTKLRDINVFVSKTRLCVHNLPKSVDNKKLKALCLQAVKGQKGVFITECRVMYDKKPEKGQVMGQSLGYGFVQFRDHEHALSALRHLNNNPDVFGPHKRPIVEFSLEDGRKLKIKEMRRQKSKEIFRKRAPKGGVSQSQTPGDGTGPKTGGAKKQPPGGSRKDKNPVQNQKSNKQFSGFRTNPEVEHTELEDGKKRKKVLPLPSHRGPKIRMRDKGRQHAPPPKKLMTGHGRKERQGRQMMEKPTQSKTPKVKATKKHFRSRDQDRFDSLVEQYKRKLMSNNDKTAAVRRNKWFDS